MAVFNLADFLILAGHIQQLSQLLLCNFVLLAECLDPASDRGGVDGLAFCGRFFCTHGGTRPPPAGFCSFQLFASKTILNRHKTIIHSHIPRKKRHWQKGEK